MGENCQLQGCRHSIVAVYAGICDGSLESKRQTALCVGSLNSQFRWFSHLYFMIILCDIFIAITKRHDVTYERADALLLRGSFLPEYSVTGESTTNTDTSTINHSL